MRRSDKEKWRESRSAVVANGRLTSPPAVRCSAAITGHSLTARRMGHIDPLLPSKIDSMNGREASGSGLRLEATVAPTAVVPERGVSST